MDTKKFAFLPYIPPKFVRCHFFVSWDSMENRTYKNILLSDKKYLCGNKQKKLEKVLFSDKNDFFKSVRHHENVIWNVVDAITGFVSQIPMGSDKKVWPTHQPRKLYTGSLKISKKCSSLRRPLHFLKTCLSKAGSWMEEQPHWLLFQFQKDFTVKG